MAGKKKSAKQLAKELEMLDRGLRVVELKKSGASFRAIAAKLKKEGSAEVTYQTVRRDYWEAMKVLTEHRLEEAEIHREMQLQRLESNLLAHYTASIGKVEKVVDPKTKEEVKKITPPSVASGWLVLGFIKEISDTLGLKVHKHEHTGKDGKPIESVKVEMTLEDWRKQSAKRREEAAKTLEQFEENE